MGLFNFLNKRIKQENILICIGKRDSESKFTVPFVEDLILYFVEDSIEGYRVISEDDFKKINLNLEELINIAKKNTKNKIYKFYKEIPVMRNEEDQVIFPYDDDKLTENGIYNFWTSLVLFDEFWNKMSEICLEKNWDKYYIAMPYRTFLIIGNANNEKSRKEIENLLDDYKKQDKQELFGSGDYEAAKRGISNDLFIMDNGKLSKANSNKYNYKEE